MGRGKLLIGLAAVGLVLIFCWIMATLQSCGLIAPAKPIPTLTSTPAEPTPTITIALAVPSKATVVPPMPTPKPTATFALSPLGQTRMSIVKALGDSNREEVNRLGAFRLDQGPPSILFVQWAINDQFTEGLIKRSAKMDIAKILRALAESSVEYGSVTLEGTFSMVDPYGNITEDVVVKAAYSRATIERIDWEGFLWDNVYVIADEVWLHPAFKQ